MQQNETIKLNAKTYRDKVNACWIGKNIGGTMGAPYEGSQKVRDIKGFVTKQSEIIPNDDLDLQLVWLNAVEKIGPLALDCAKLGEFWCSYIVPYWNEYGIAKANMQRGISAPLSGDYHNNWKHSNGAWIRTEIWATLAPACPDLAAKYAVEDAKVDHGTGEGTMAAAFIAAMQSAAFALNDIRACIDVALEKIPENCRVATSVRKIIELYEAKVPAADARNIIQRFNADIGDGWFEAPSNVAYTILGLLYGEGDFKKSMITAINCGDDTDCTGASVGATLGILNGTAGIPKDWRDYLGDGIVTVSINRAVGLRVPKTCEELTERTVRQAPVMLLANRAPVEIVTGKDEIPADTVETFRRPFPLLPNRTAGIREALLAMKPYSVIHDLTYATATLTWENAPDIKPGESKKLTIRFENKFKVFGNIPYDLRLRWILPEGFTASGGESALFLAHMNQHNNFDAETVWTITAGETVAPVNRIALEVIAEGRPTVNYIPLVLLG